MKSRAAEKNVYDSLPEKIKKTAFGQKLLEVSQKDYSVLKMEIRKLKEDHDIFL